MSQNQKNFIQAFEKFYIGLVVLCSNFLLASVAFAQVNQFTIINICFESREDNFILQGCENTKRFVQSHCPDSFHYIEIVNQPPAVVEERLRQIAESGVVGESLIFFSAHGERHPADESQSILMYDAGWIPTVSLLAMAHRHFPSAPKWVTACYSEVENLGTRYGPVGFGSKKTVPEQCSDTTCRGVSEVVLTNLLCGYSLDPLEYDEDGNRRLEESELKQAMFRGELVVSALEPAQRTEKILPGLVQDTGGRAADFFAGAGQYSQGEGYRIIDTRPGYKVDKYVCDFEKSPDGPQEPPGSPPPEPRRSFRNHNVTECFETEQAALDDFDRQLIARLQGDGTTYTGDKKNFTVYGDSYTNCDDPVIARCTFFTCSTRSRCKAAFFRQPSISSFFLPIVLPE